jgi:hypothetical protein
VERARMRDVDILSLIRANSNRCEVVARGVSDLFTVAAQEVARHAEKVECHGG